MNHTELLNYLNDKNSKIYFDWKFYLDYYPDLRKSGINNEILALRHWNKYGKKAGRICNEHSNKKKYEDKFKKLDNELLKKLPNVFYINLKHRKDRNDNIINQFKWYPQNKLKRIDAVNMEDGALGCALSHVKAFDISMEINDNLEYIIVIEDDFYWKHNELYTKIYLDRVLSLKKNWNVLLLGCLGHGVKSDLNYLNKANDSQTTTGYIIKKSYIPKLRDLWKNVVKSREKNSKSNKFIDMEWKKLQNENWYIPIPTLAYQIDSYSDIEKEVRSYKDYM